MPEEPGPGGGGPERIAAAFAGHGRRAALMPYVMGGFPDVDGSRRLAEACLDAGADLMEVGVPFSDPLADGPAIHSAATRALAAGTTLDDVLALCEAVADRVPPVLMTYFNAILARGIERFCVDACAAGAAGVIVPDLPHDESEPMRTACAASRLALVPLAAPTTTPERLQAIGADAEGFVYAVSLAGTTGERDELPAGLEETVARVRSASRLPVAVGFGISTPGQASRVADLADGVIVASRIVRAAEDGGPPAARELVVELGAAVA